MRLRWLFATVFVLTLGVLITFTIWTGKSNSLPKINIPTPDSTTKSTEQKVIPKIQPVITLSDLKQNVILYGATELNNALKDNNDWRRAWLIQELTALGFRRITDTSYMKVGSSDDDRFVITSGYTKEGAVQLLTIAQALAPLHTKKSYVFCIDTNYTYKNPTLVGISCCRGHSFVFANNIDIKRKLKLCTVNQPFNAEYQDHNFVIIRPTEQEDEIATMLRLCNFNLNVISLYDEGFFNEQ